MRRNDPNEGGHASGRGVPQHQPRSRADLPGGPVMAVDPLQQHADRLGDHLCGASRPNHFRGVTTVVSKSFHAVQPDVAVFGQKDYQQLLVIRRLVRDLAMPVEIVAAPTLREANGLAMSSRNQYLTGSERARAGVIQRTLKSMGDAARAGVAVATIEADARRLLEADGLAVDYVVLRRAADLDPPTLHPGAELVALAAAKLGRARLIDNFLIDL